MEINYKKDPSQHLTVNKERFSIRTNKGKIVPHLEVATLGTYNSLLCDVDKSLYDSERLNWADSHEMFHDSFPTFAWEVIEVLAFPDLGNPNWPNVPNPDNVAFTWRHWGHFTGSC